MNKLTRIGIVAALVAIVTVVVATKHNRTAPFIGPSGTTGLATGLPRLVDLGSTTCIPCQKMIPVLEELKTQLAGRLEVEFVDVTENPDAAKRYKVEMIPTQVFLDASGREKDRHLGYWSTEDILAHWKKLGFDLSSRPGEDPRATAQPEVKSGST